MNPSRRVVVALSLSIAAGSAPAHQVAHGDLVLAHPYVELASACASDVTRGQVMLIINHGTQPDRLLAAELDHAGRGRLVRATTVDGRPTRQVLADGIEIPAKGQLALMAPDLTLEFPKSRSPLMEGGAAQGSLTFRRSGKVAVTFMVDAAHEGPGAPGCGGTATKAAHAAHAH